MPVSGTYDVSLRGVWYLWHYSPILRVSKLKFSCSSSEPESFEDLVFKLFLYIRNYFTALYTRVFSSLPSAGCFLAPWNLTWPAPPPGAVDQVDLMGMACARMTLHEFKWCPGPYRGHTGEFFFFVLFLLAPSSKAFAAWYDPLLCADLVD